MGSKENYITVLHLKLKSRITLKHTETGQLKGVLAHLQQR